MKTGSLCHQTEETDDAQPWKRDSSGSSNRLITETEKERFRCNSQSTQFEKHNNGLVNTSGASLRKGAANMLLLLLL